MSAQPANPNTPPDHVAIEINGRELFAPKGAMIIQIADKAGIAIPRFCYHPKLAIAANCRMCMVEVELGGRPMPKPQPACATPVADGMKIFTHSQRALSAQRNVMEFLLINHPLDCPICDQGGECELQDLSMGYGRSVSRFVERKRVVPDEDLGPLVETEMTRCIQCTRCVRVMGEVAGTYELGGMDRGEMLQIGTYVGKPLMSEVSGNVIDVCPVGALTDKPYRFRARAWELIARESIGFHDALGSNIWLHTRRGEVLRTVPRDNDAVNECWLSDRDRYSHQGLYADDRARTPMLKRNGRWLNVSWDDAIRAASDALRGVSGDRLGTLLHPATSNEEGYLLAQLTRGLGSAHIDHRLRQLDFSDRASAVPFEMPLAEIERADVIVLVGCNPRNELPLLNVRLRKAVKQGAKVYAINPHSVDATFDLAGERVVAPSQMVDVLLALANAAGPADSNSASSSLSKAIGEQKADDFSRDLAKVLSAAGSSVFVVGEMATAHPHASWLRAATELVARKTASAYNEIPLGANAVGLTRVLALPEGDGLDASAQCLQARDGYILYGIESASDFADGAATWNALSQAKTVIAISAFASDALKQVASVILPIGLLPEIDATLTNLDGINQIVAAGAKLPGEARPGWKVLRALGGSLGLDGFGFTEIGEVRKQLPDRAELPVDDKDVGNLAQRTGKGLAGTDISGLQRLTTTAIYRSDAVVRRATALNAHPLNRGACVALHPEDALALGIGSDGAAKIGETVLPVTITLDVPRGVAWIESGYVETEMLPPYGRNLAITKADGEGAR
ncbi:MAG: NADH-quinone oxidoreductase subunit NuoG [Dokdonella sp.]